MGGVILQQVKDLLHLCFYYMANGSPGMLSGLIGELFKTAALSFVVMAGPFLAVTALLAVGVTFFQTKMLVAGESIKPKFNRISPLQGFKRLFSLRSIIEAVKGILSLENHHSALSDLQLLQQCGDQLQPVFKHEPVAVLFHPLSGHRHAGPSNRGGLHRPGILRLSLSVVGLRAPAENVEAGD